MQDQTHSISDALAYIYLPGVDMTDFDSVAPGMIDVSYYRIVANDLLYESYLSIYILTSLLSNLSTPTYTFELKEQLCRCLLSIASIAQFSNNLATIKQHHFQIMLNQRIRVPPRCPDYTGKVLLYFYKLNSFSIIL